MKDIIEKMKINPLFSGIAPEDIKSMTDCLEGRVRGYDKGEFVQLAGEPFNAIGIVIAGTVQVLREDSEGRRNLMAEIGEGELFGEVFACAGVTESPVSVLATDAVQILHLNFHKIITACTTAWVV